MSAKKYLLARIWLEKDLDKIFKIIKRRRPNFPKSSLNKLYIVSLNEIGGSVPSKS